MASIIGALTGQTAQAPALNLGQTQGLGGMFSSMPDVQQWANFGGGFAPSVQNTIGGMGFGNPFASGAIGSSVDASNIGAGVAGNVLGTGDLVTGSGLNLPGVGAGIIPSAYNTMGAGQSLFGPGASLFGTGASLFGPGYETMAQAQNLFPMGNAAAAAGGGLIPYAGQILNTGFDPQQSLYSRTAQQVQDQTRAAEAARGIQSSPYGAGLEADQMRNFNIDWQNQQLARQAQAGGAASGLIGAGTGAMGTGANIYGTGFGGTGTGANIIGQGANIFGTGAGIFGTGGGLASTGANMLGTYGGLTGTGANVAQTGTGMEMMAPQYLASMGALPYSTFQGISSDQLNAIMQAMGYAGSAQGLAQTPMQDYATMYGLGNTQQNIANAIYGNQIKQQQNQFQDLAKIMGGVSGMPWSNIMGGLGSMFGGTGGTAGSALAGTMQ